MHFRNCIGGNYAAYVKICIYVAYLPHISAHISTYSAYFSTYFASKWPAYFKKNFRYKPASLISVTPNVSVPLLPNTVWHWVSVRHHRSHCDTWHELYWQRVISRLWSSSRRSSQKVGRWTRADGWGGLSPLYLLGLGCYPRKICENVAANLCYMAHLRVKIHILNNLMFNLDFVTSIWWHQVIKIGTENWCFFYPTFTSGKEFTVRAV